MSDISNQETSINSNHAETLHFLTEIAKGRTSGYLWISTLLDDKDAPNKGVEWLSLHVAIDTPIKSVDLKYKMDEAHKLGRGFFINTVTTDASRKRNEKPKGEIGDDKYDPGCHCLDPLAIVADYDKGVIPPTDEQLIELLSPLPTVRVKSGGGWHLWWFLKENSCSKDIRNKIVERIAIVTHADESMKSDTRILRLPGSVHLKNPAEPKLVTIVEDNYDRRYTPPDFEQFLATTEPEPELKQTKSKSKSKIKESDPSNSDIRSFAPYLVGFNDGGGDWIKAKCPAHDGGSSDSLHINSKTGGFKCHAECDSSSIYNAAKAVAVAGGHQVEEKRKKDSEGNPPELWIADDFTDAVLKDQTLFDTTRKKYWQYDGSGVWENIDDDYVFKKCLDYLRPIVPVFNPRYVDNVLRFAKSKILISKLDEPSNLEYIPFKNGVLNLTTKELLPHTPTNKFTWQLPRNYSPEKTDWTNIDNFLNTFSDGNEQIKKLMIAGCNAVLIGRSDLHKCFVLVGDGRNGKGAYIDLNAMLIGENNIHPTSMKELNENRFEPANFINKRLVTMPDEGKYTGRIDVWKSVVGGDPIKAERKNEHAFHFRFKGLIFIAANQPLFGSEKGYPVQERIVYIPCTKTVEKENRRNLIPEFESEIEAFTNYLLSLDNDEVKRTIVNACDVDAVSDLGWKLMTESDSIAAFYDVALVPERGCGLIVKDLFSEYKKFCETSKLLPKSVNIFTKDLIGMCASKVLTHKVERDKKYGVRLVMGIRFRDRIDDEPANPPTESEKFTIEQDAQKKYQAYKINPFNL